MKHNESQYLGLLYRILPFLEWLKGYQMSFLRVGKGTGELYYIQPSC